MKVACIDFEGVLVPEIWISLAERTGIDDLKLTTRDIPDYDELMGHRLGIMDKHGLRFKQLLEAAEGLEPLPGAADFLAWLRSEFQVAIISDTFHELARPLVAKLGCPVILCHRLEIDADDRIVGYHIRQADPKRCAVKAFQSLNYEVVATGDSYNDISMLSQAERGFFFCPSDKVTRDYPDIPVARDYDALRAMFAAALA
ncbi:MAG: bifunctional phosphoserine phosphatase/homoserine phosphotransferase ThrH [Gammaproteobacteria bacterium]|nr:bifunctional phosphoserine phosphatase/homoserine phosphotransferase ThrH [Gammaproteobacteria bacterium]MCP5198395.1 bifunctional phosphoserine phosphatase/homoserine phosphotransferase ThrH [Gammaproteobacteria bacterium]